MDAKSVIGHRHNLDEQEEMRSLCVSFEIQCYEALQHIKNM